ncbi:fatty acid hydroxylase superfamily-domain-containing protein [Aspergillus pseudocaelatus]|uniref:Fatty acid hydroxylase superfamily-domain-containing protein n=1 Tax=Aspergillus pseudocaelatus TaxID=1825620 RepID=A0ABQ6WSH3_9EURO|nr:fatty acid hydroxylase superfamily-domain-containing protein [Aspergillus pseudocaelatus]
MLIDDLSTSILGTESMDYHRGKVLNYVAEEWSYIVANYSPESIELLGTFAVHFAFYWFGSLVFALADIYAPSSILKKYKIQSISKQPSRQVMLQCIPSALQNQLITTALHALKLLALRSITGRFAGYRIERTLPSLLELMTDIPLCFIGRDFVCYYDHRILHLPWLYRRFHKEHHKFTAPVAVAAEHTHPLDHILINVLPVVVPATLFRVHLVTFWLLMSSTILQGSLGHSGWHVRSVFGRKTTAHDAHHELFDVEYGTLGLMDWLHGTNYTGKHKSKGKGKVH